jgi:hypothetical protein
MGTGRWIHGRRRGCFGTYLPPDMQTEVLPRGIVTCSVEISARPRVGWSVKELLESMASGVMWRLLMLPFLIVPILIYLIVKNAPKPGSKDSVKKGKDEPESR